jgi:hypothetical protein
MNLILVFLALRAWWLESGESVTGATDDSHNTVHGPPLVATVHRWSQPSAVPLSGNRPLDTVYCLLPWILLGLLFYIPGVYLEFPADPWQHYARVNEWSWQQTVTEHATWPKSSYFLAYSFIGHIAPPLFQLKWFDVYYTGCCLLLCWQYYRLARVVGLSERASFVFVLLNTLTFGNNIFGFYRYYGISSSLFAQLGAVALTRIALEVAKHPQLSLRSFFSLPSAFAGRSTTIIPSTGDSSPSTFAGRRARTNTRLAAANNGVPPPTVYWLLPTVAALVALIAFNHVQGLVIAGLGIGAVVIWRLIEWRRPMVWWLALAAIGLSAATILWYPRNSALGQIYRPQGWLTSWYGFNLFQPSSPAFDRTAAIIGLSGLVNLIAGLVLLRRNHVAAWLTLLPVVALCLPLFAIPFASALVSRDVGEIVAYHRLLFAIPVGLALVALGARRLQTSSFVPADRLPSTVHLSAVSEGLRALRLPSSVPFALLLAPCSLLILALSALTLTPASSQNFNRFYHALMRPPADLSMHHVLEAIDELDLFKADERSTTLIIANAGPASVISATGLRRVSSNNRRMNYPSAFRIGPAEYSVVAVVQEKRQIAVLTLFFGHELHTPISFNGFLSQHWLPQEVSLDHLGGPELEHRAYDLGFRKVETGGFKYYLYNPK